MADITYLNLNVVYEIGFAIGKSKRAFLVRHKSTAGDLLVAKAVGIFDTLGYHEYETFDDLKARLEAHIDAVHLNFSNDPGGRSVLRIEGSKPRCDARLIHRHGT